MEEPNSVIHKLFSLIHRDEIAFVFAGILQNVTMEKTYILAPLVQ